MNQAEKNRLYDLSIVDKTTKRKAEKARQQAELPDTALFGKTKGSADYTNKLMHNVHIALCLFCDEHDVR